MKSLSKILSTLLLTNLLIGCSTPAGSSSSSSEPSSDSEVVSTNNFYENPIYPLYNGQKKETYLADPYVIRDEDTLKYYMYTTQSDVFIDGTIGSVFKRGPIYESIDLVNWTYKADSFVNYTPNWGTSGAGVWAPTVVKIGDYYNLYYSLSIGGDDNPGIGVARSETPYGPFTHYGKLFNSEEIGVTNSIDPHVLVDNGKVYMVFGSYGGLISLIELTSDGLGLQNGVEYQKENKIALAGYELYEMNNYEASLILQYNGYYYLFLSTGTCCSGFNSTYNVVIAKSDKITGPYLDSQGRNMFGPKRGDTVVAPSIQGAMGVGHNGIAMDDAGDFWMIYHGYDTQGAKPDWRVTYLDKLYIDPATEMFYVKNRRASNGELLPGPFINQLEGVS